MNRLPNAHLAVIEESKITGYLLSDSHPTGRSKAAYFRQFGFQALSWRTLRDALFSHLGTSEAQRLSTLSSVQSTLLKGCCVRQTAESQE